MLQIVALLLLVAGIASLLGRGRLRRAALRAAAILAGLALVLGAGVVILMAVLTEGM